MSFTVDDALKLKCLKDAKIVAGLKGIKNEIRFVNVMEVPDISDWISGYELLLTTGYPYKNSDKDWEELLLSLKKGQLSAFAMKTDRYIKKIPEEIIRAGDELDVPIIQLPDMTRFDLIIRDIMREITNRDYKTIKKSEEIHRLFTELILSGGGLEEIARTLARLSFSKVTIIDENGEILEGTTWDNRVKYKSDIIRTVEKKPVYVNNEIAGYITMTPMDEPFDEEDIVAMERAVDAVAMVLLKEKTTEEIEKKYRNDFLNDIVNGEVQSEETVIERGKFFGIDFNNEYLLFLLDVDSFEKVFLQKLKKDESVSQNLLTRLFRFVFDAFFSKAENSIIWDKSDGIIVLYPINRNDYKSNEDLKRISKDIAKQIKQRVDNHIKEFTVSIGIGRFYSNIMDVHHSYNQAREAIRLGKLVWGHNGIYHYDDLETYNILMRCGDRNELEGYVNLKLGRLIGQDRKKDTQLLQTLEVLLENDCNMKLTADKMFVHPKTIAYRKEQIEKILNITLDNMEEKFSIYMALKIKDIFNL